MSLRGARLSLFPLLILLAWASPVRAHKLMISVLHLKQVAPGEYLAHWQRVEGVSDASAAYLLLRPTFPEHCAFEPPRLRCGARGLVGRIGFSGLSELSSSALLQIERADAPLESYAFSANEPQRMRQDRAPQARGFALVHSFVALGVEHILFGWDHLAFVLGLLWLVASKRALIKTVTAFTLGHSITLSAAALGYTQVPAAPVEAAIALSIALVALEAVKRARGHAPGLSARAPWLVALGFGLLHGFGFASALAEAELSRAELPLALLGFNLGVELGQLAFVLAVLLLSALAARAFGPAVQRLRLLTHYGLGALAMYWVFERVAAFSAG
jgi:hypothetical protein